jgi:DNA-binding transcriptional MerR regulator
MLRIGELPQIAGVTPRLLRHYEAIGCSRPR